MGGGGMGAEGERSSSSMIMMARRQGGGAVNSHTGPTSCHEVGLRVPHVLQSLIHAHPSSPSQTAASKCVRAKRILVLCIAQYHPHKGIASYFCN